MQGVVKYGLKDKNVELREMPEPVVRSEDALVEVSAAGICGSDVEFWRHKITFPINVPVILGHEFCGIIRKVGADVKAFKVGDRIVSETSAEICGTCEFCRAGEYNLCPSRLGFGYGVNGAFTHYVRVPQRCLHHIPEHLSFKHAAMTEPACVAYNAVCVQSRVMPGELVVVLGAGTIGLLSALMARISGAEVLITGLSVDTKRLAIAKSIGIDHRVVADREDVVKQVMRLTDGVGAPLVIDAVGIPEVTRQAMAIIRRNGQITKLGWGGEPYDATLDPLVAKAVRLQGSFSHTWRTWENCIKLLASGRLPADKFITHEFPLVDWEEAFTLVENRHALKVIFHPKA